MESLYDQLLEAYYLFAGKVQMRLFLAKVGEIVLTFLRNGAAYAVLIYMVLQGRIGVPEFLLSFTAVAGFAAWITGILENVSEVRRYSIELCAVREYLSYPELFKFEEGAALVPEPERLYELKLENVSFRYPGADHDVLKNVNFTLHPGEKVAVVGLNGAGKTTLVKLLCGFLDPTEGRVLLDGRDIREYNRRDYYKLFTAVFQDFSLLAVSIAANVAQSEENIDMARVRDCIDRAGLTAKIESLPEGYDTKLLRSVHFDAVELSGGETQRLMLARALYRNAPVIVLDEPTAALDPIAESEMYGKYHEMTAGRSSVYISHRLASTRFCDRILYIEDAGIAEEGTHEELLARGGRYAALFEVQSRYYREGGMDDEK